MSDAPSHVVPLADCAPDRVAEVGGKTKGLYSLISLGFPVPDGFAITAKAYRSTLAATGADSVIAGLLARDDLSDSDKAQAIQDAFCELSLPDDLVRAIESGYSALGAGPVAVRSSGIAEDTQAASFAGQHDTYLWVEGLDAVVACVLRCWASSYNAGAIGYRRHFDVRAEDVAMGVVVQRMVAAAAGGVMMTLEPVTGDRSQIYIEAVQGLGEGVVVGDVLADQFWFDKATLEPLRSTINQQSAHYVPDPASGKVALLPLDAERGAQPALTPDAAAQLADYGRRIEAAFGMAMDVEWAVSAAGEILMLQARPETVWQNATGSESTQFVSRGRPGPGVMHGDLNPHWYYSTANLGEAAPGVLAPLTWSVWGPGAEIAARYGFTQMGVLESNKAGFPENPQERFIQIAYGRAVASVSAFYEMGERIPGASGDMIAESLLGSIPDGMTPCPTKRRYPFVLWKMPRAFARAKRVLAKQNAEFKQWWTDELRRTPQLDLPGAQAQFRNAAENFHRATSLQAQGNIIAVPPVFDALEKLATDAGMKEQFGALTAGHGDHAETEVVADLWEVSRGRLSEQEFLARHGFHGTLEGDIAGRVWREDPTPIRRLAQMYRDQPESKNPRAITEQRMRERQSAEAELMSRFGPVGRLKARIVLRLARRHMPLRGIGKASFLRSLDVARASARRIGEILVSHGLIDEIDDVMFLTADELTAPVIPVNARELIADRRAEHAFFSTLELPVAFWGEPEPRTAQAVTPSDTAVDRLSGIGASAGIVEGPARVVLDPAFSEVEPGEILVAATTDPSWASIMFVSSALIVDIGGVLSHAAVVARELRIPCVVNTANGTTALRTGDRVRVNGAEGTVEILERAR